MPDLQLSSLLELTKAQQVMALAEVNAELEALSAQERVQWAFENLQGEFALSSSFGIQAAVMLHLVTQVKSNVPVILTDTGYLFPETYQFIDELTERLSLDLRIYRAEQSANWQEARYGKLWEQGVEGIEKYNRINKVEPMRRALDELSVGTWFSGLRREQSSTRGSLPILGIQNGVFKFLPVIDWTPKDVHYYLQQNELPYHPLWEQGYVSVGDVQTSRKLEEGMTEEETRFFGLKRECGLHEDDVTDGAGI
ncbi:phosphoadenosine phosphosulfate reductase [Veronia nyctiphanis]|uniref:Phosphoadenosine 5'-phosphosulfate reductase n=1 Tax=Veronia nyctiphanis TaxID=1278244 RepID=A0A4Q0YRR0_9GAMM|nr:phosphoadenylyl-sulfate reductase [Veronia nyctiphanis]RXJ73345.1 phosphoadenosine phosphosulfate reductase [Veronia nyctiphanis]